MPKMQKEPQFSYVVGEALSYTLWLHMSFSKYVVTLFFILGLWFPGLQKDLIICTMNHIEVFLF